MKWKEIDPLIAPYVALLNKYGIHTDWSCQGHPGEFYPTGFRKPDHGKIGGNLKRLSEIKKITELLVGEGCHCGTCKDFSINVALNADARGVQRPIGYHYTINFDTHITEQSLKEAVTINSKLEKIVKQKRTL